MSTHSAVLHPPVAATVHAQRGRWHVVMQNEIRRAFSGADAFRRACDMALYLNDRDLAGLVAAFVRDYPRLWQTAHRAALLVLQRHLSLPVSTRGTQRNVIALARSAAESRTRYVLRRNRRGDLSCTCPSFCEQPYYGSRGKPFCKHLLAYYFHGKLGVPLPQAPAPDEVWTALRDVLRTRLQPAVWEKLFERATLAERSTRSRLVILVEEPAVAALLNLPQWQEALNAATDTLVVNPVSIRATASRCRRSVPSSTRAPEDGAGVAA